MPSNWMLDEEDDRQQLTALLAKRGLQLQPIPEAAPTQVQASARQGAWEGALPSSGFTWHLSIKKSASVEAVPVVPVSSGSSATGTTVEAK